MSETAGEFDALLKRARGGDADALTQLIRQYEADVRLVARRRLGPALRPYADSLDLVQSVHKSLLIGLQQNKYQIDNPEQLVALALTIVRRKIARIWTRLQQQKRLSGEFASPESTLPERLAALPDPEADPARAAALADAVRHLCQDLDETERRVLEMRLQGYRTAEIARALGLGADALRAHLSRLRRSLRFTGVWADWV